VCGLLRVVLGRCTNDGKYRGTNDGSSEHSNYYNYRGSTSNFDATDQKKKQKISGYNQEGNKHKKIYTTEIPVQQKGEVGVWTTLGSLGTLGCINYGVGNTFPWSFFA
jgi:hypothetical protein